jgi:RNA polymerase sigma-70 factor (ECF subfamily)
MNCTVMRTPAGAARHEAWTSQAIARAKLGDRHAVRYLYAHYAADVRSYLGSLLRDPDLVDDVVQTTFLKVLTKIDRYEPGDSPFEAWLLRVARNAAFDELRRRRTGAGAARPLADADAVAAGEQLGGDVWDALDRLPAAWREVLVLRHVLGLSVREVASRLQMSPQGVRALQDRASASVRGTLGGDNPHRRCERRFRRDDHQLVQRIA